MQPTVKIHQMNGSAAMFVYRPDAMRILFSISFNNQ